MDGFWDLVGIKDGPLSKKLAVKVFAHRIRPWTFVHFEATMKIGFEIKNPLKSLYLRKLNEYSYHFILGTFWPIHENLWQLLTSCSFSILIGY